MNPCHGDDGRFSTRGQGKCTGGRRLYGQGEGSTSQAPHLRRTALPPRRLYGQDESASPRPRKRRLYGRTEEAVDRELDDAIEEAIRLTEAWSPQARAASILSRRGRRPPREAPEAHPGFNERRRKSPFPREAPEAHIGHEERRRTGIPRPKAPSTTISRPKAPTVARPSLPTAAPRRAPREAPEAHIGHEERRRTGGPVFARPPTQAAPAAPTARRPKQKKPKPAMGHVPREAPEEHPGHHEYERIRSGMRRDERDTLDREYAKAKKAGFKGRRSSFLGQQFRKYQSEPEGSPNAPKIFLYGESYEKLDKIHSKPKKRKTRETQYDGMDDAIEAVLRESDAGVYGTDDYSAIVGELREYNQCHAPNSGQFCSGKGGGGGAIRPAGFIPPYSGGIAGRTRDKGPKPKKGRSATDLERLGRQYATQIRADIAAGKSPQPPWAVPAMMPSTTGTPPKTMKFSAQQKAALQAGRSARVMGLSSKQQRQSARRALLQSRVQSGLPVRKGLGTAKSKRKGRLASWFSKAWRADIYGDR